MRKRDTRAVRRERVEFWGYLFATSAIFGAGMGVGVLASAPGEHRPASVEPAPVAVVEVANTPAPVLISDLMNVGTATDVLDAQAEAIHWEDALVRFTAPLPFVGFKLEEEGQTLRPYVDGVRCPVALIEGDDPRRIAMVNERGAEVAWVTSAGFVSRCAHEVEGGWARTGETEEGTNGTLEYMEWVDAGPCWEWHR